MLSNALLFLATLLGFAAIMVDYLLLGPAPNSQFWVAAVAISELSLYASILASLVFVGTSFTLRNGKHVRRKLLFAAIFLITALITVMPTVQALMLAQRRNIPLSFKEYFTGSAVSDIRVLRDVRFTEVDGTPLELDVYSSVKRHGHAPAVIVIHGGSWRTGRKSDVKHSSDWLASLGYVVFDVNYRLAADGARFPVQLHDVEKAIDWVRAQADEYGVDRSRIALLGRSAGAQLAILAAYRDGKRNSLPTDEVRCVVSYYAPTDMEWDYMNPAIPDVIHAVEVLENFLGGAPVEKKTSYMEASPTEQAKIHAVPTLLIHGQRDQIVRFENVQLLTSKLEAAKVPFEVVDLPWANHGFDVNPTGWASQISNAEVAAFLKRYLGK